MPRDEHQTRIELINPALYNSGWGDSLIREEKTPGGTDIIDGRPRKRKGRTDYLLCIQIVGGKPPLPVAVLEAKAEDKLPSLGIQQAKDYMKKFNVPFAFSTNGNLYAEYGEDTGQIRDALKIIEFPSPDELKRRYEELKGLNFESEAARPIVYTEAETHASMSRSVVKPKDVLINIVGPPIGKICWYPENQPEANINQAVVRVHCPEDLDYRFLTYLLRTKNYYDYFFEVKVGVRQWNISRTNCADIKIPRVPLSLQHELVKKFEEKIDGNPLVVAAERQLEAIEALPGAILREIFDFEEENTGS